MSFNNYELEMIKEIVEGKLEDFRSGTLFVTEDDYEQTLVDIILKVNEQLVGRDQHNV